MTRSILALDRGTTSSRAILFDRGGRSLASVQQEFEQIFPAPGQVEHDPEVIWSSQITVARQVLAPGGVYLVPAFVGLGAPHWDPYARGTIVGITRGTTASHLARAAVDSMAYQTRDVLEVMQRESGRPLQSLRVDGGAAANNQLLQFQADILGVAVRRPVVAETTALGAAYLAGLAVGYWNDTAELEANWALDREFVPSIDRRERDRLYGDWRRAVERSLGWAAPRG